MQPSLDSAKDEEEEEEEEARDMGGGDSAMPDTLRGINVSNMCQFIRCFQEKFRIKNQEEIR